LKEKADEIYERTSRIRYYIKPDEVILLADNVLISTSTQWNIETIKPFIEHVKKLNAKYKIELE
jgi:hypothetical protein